MNIILLSGGSGKRLWPLSNEARSKQFLKILRKDDKSESMIQRAYRKIEAVDPDANILVATVQSQESYIMNQLGDAINISVEPGRRDTFPAIALAASYMHDVMHVGEDDAVVVLPSDSWAEDSFFDSIEKLYRHVLNSEQNLCLMGVEPNYPSEKYGYIVPKTGSEISEVAAFKEKPEESAAKEYIRQGAMWNCGVFAFKLNYLLDVSQKTIGTSNYQELFSDYNNLEKISFDYAVVEKEPKIDVLRYSGNWSDLGTWNDLVKVFPEPCIGQHVEKDCEDVYLINELSTPVFLNGLNNVIVAASPDGILITDADKTNSIKKTVESFDHRPMYEERKWGEYRVLYETSYTTNSLTKELIIEAGKNISYQEHYLRDEIWTVVEGEGQLLLNGEVSSVKCGDTVKIAKGVKHAVRAFTRLHIIEVQIGDDLVEEDITRYDWNWEG